MVGLRLVQNEGLRIFALENYKLGRYILRYIKINKTSRYTNMLNLIWHQDKQNLKWYQDRPLKHHSVWIQISMTILVRWRWRSRSCLWCHWSGKGGHCPMLRTSFSHELRHAMGWWYLYDMDIYIYTYSRHSYMHIYIQLYLIWWYRLMIRLGFMILMNDDCNDVRMAWKILLHDVIPLSVVLYPPVRHDKTQPTIQSHQPNTAGNFYKKSTTSSTTRNRIQI